MFGLRVKALKDDARVLGLVLRAGAEIDLDILAAQAPAVQASVDAGDIALLSGGPLAAPPVALYELPKEAIKPESKPAEQTKGKGK